MAPAPLVVRPGHVFKPSGRQLITLYLGGQALRGELSDAVIPGGCYIAAGVDIFSASPDALPFKPSHRRQHGEVWGYFSAAQPADDIQPAPGGCWVRCGPEKGYEYEQGGEAFGFRRRFAFHATRLDGDGRVMWAHTRWLMKEYRLNKGGAAFRHAVPGPKANMDFVVRKVFTKPVAPATPPAGPSRSSKALRRGERCLPPPSARPRKMTKAFTKPVHPLPLPVRSSEETGPAAFHRAKPDHPKAIKDLVAFTKPVVPAPPPARSSEEENPISNYPSVSEEAGCSNGEDQAKNRAACVFKPSGRDVIREYLIHKALRGDLTGSMIPSYIVEGVDIFSASPDALPFQPNQRGEHGELWGYFFAAQPADDTRTVPGGCWARYGGEKGYGSGVEAAFFRRRFAFHMAWMDGDGREMRAQTRWLMKEYRLNKDAAAFRSAWFGPNRNMDSVVHKVFMKPVVPPPPPPPPPPPGSEHEAGGPSAACPPPARSSKYDAGGPSAATCLQPPARSSQYEAGGPSAATCPPPPPARSNENGINGPSAAACLPTPARSSENEASDPSAATCPLQPGGDQPGFQLAQHGRGPGDESHSI